MNDLNIDLTIDPNDQKDWGDYGAKCSCGSECLDSIDGIATTPENHVRLWCMDCGNEFNFKL